MKKLLTILTLLISTPSFSGEISSNLTDDGINSKNKYVSCLEREARLKYDVQDFKFLEFTSDFVGVGRRFGWSSVVFQGSRYKNFKAKITTSDGIEATFDCYVISNIFDDKESVKIYEYPKYCSITSKNTDAESNDLSYLKRMILGVGSDIIRISQESCSTEE